MYISTTSIFLKQNKRPTDVQLASGDSLAILVVPVQEPKASKVPAVVGLRRRNIDPHEKDSLEYYHQVSLNEGDCSAELIMSRNIP